MCRCVWNRNTLCSGRDNLLLVADQRTCLQTQTPSKLSAATDSRPSSDRKAPLLPLSSRGFAKKRRKWGKHGIKLRQIRWTYGRSCLFEVFLNDLFLSCWFQGPWQCVLLLFRFQKSKFRVYFVFFACVYELHRGPDQMVCGPYTVQRPEVPHPCFRPFNYSTQLFL